MTKPGRSHQERSAAMRERLLDATVASLVEKGYGGTTTLEVQQRAGVSRGALLHHYASRAELIVAAVEHLAEQAAANLADLASREQGSEDQIEWAVRTLWHSIDDRLFMASLELWLAARSDAGLRTALIPLERRLGRAANAWAAELFGDVAENPDFPALLEILSDAMRGAVIRAVVRSPGSDERLIAEWVELAKDMLEDGRVLTPRSARNR